MQKQRRERARRQSVTDRKMAVRKKRQARKRRMMFAGCYVALVVGCCIYLYGAVRQNAGEGELHRPDGIHSVQSEQKPVDVIKLDELHSPYAILLDVETGQVLAEKNSEGRMYPASITKLMAALVAVEHTEDWSAKIEIPQEIFTKLYFEHASLAGFEPGEKVTPEELLYGMLLPSGAECCSTYAAWLAGDEETFVEWMNEKAAELGMASTHFTNTSGLHDEKHYSTAKDMAILLGQCLQNEKLKIALSAENYQTQSTTQHPQGLTLESTLFQAIAGSSSLTKMYTKLQRAGVTQLGGKTGYTSQAGLCLASFADVNGREYLLVTAGAEGNHYTEPFHIEDALTVYHQIAEVLQ